MIVVDETLALLAAAGRPHAALTGEVPALTYGRAYRLTRALLDPGPGRLAIRGRFTRLVDGLSAADRAALHARLADSSVVEVVDPRPLIRAAGAVQNTYSVSLLQAETLAAAATHDWRNEPNACETIDQQPGHEGDARDRGGDRDAARERDLILSVDEDLDLSLGL